MGYIAAVIIIGMFIFYIASYCESNRLIVKEIDVPHASMRSKKKVLFFSDIHFGKWYHPKHIIAMIAKIQAIQPDVILIGGDFIDHFKRDQKQLDISWIIQQMQEISCSHIYAIMGNHDGKAYRDIMKACGIRILENEKITIDDLEIIGLEDGLSGNPSLKDITMVSDRVHLVLVHEPDIADELIKDQINIILSGHTHGGQVGIPILRNMVLPKKGKHYRKGEYALTKTCTLFVSSGIGRTGLPLRLGNPPEMLLLHMTPKN